MRSCTSLPILRVRQEEAAQGTPAPPRVRGADVTTPPCQRTCLPGTASLGGVRAGGRADSETQRLAAVCQLPEDASVGLRE